MVPADYLWWKSMFYVWNERLKESRMAKKSGVNENRMAQAVAQWRIKRGIREMHPPLAHIGAPSLNGEHYNLKSHRSVC